MYKLFFSCIIFFALKSASAQKLITSSKSSSGPDTPRIMINLAYPKPLIDNKHPQAGNNRYGFEGGRVIKINHTYHLFTSEMTGEPMWVKMKLGYWTSNDRIHWNRNATIRESSGNFDGTDERAAYWSPLPVWDKQDNSWHLFYVAYKASPPDGKSFRYNYDGRIIHAVSTKTGYNGIAGPYKDKGIILSPGKDSEPWEGLQGVDSFFPWQIGNKWYAFYGSANTEKMPVDKWQIGMASSGSLDSGWKRMPEMNPVKIEKRFIENPIVTEVAGLGWFCVYDNDVKNTFGLAFSKDGINWFRKEPIKISENTPLWGKDIRTPLGLIHEKGNLFTIFYTAYKNVPNWDEYFSGKRFNTSRAIGFIEVTINAGIIKKGK